MMTSLIKQVSERVVAEKMNAEQAEMFLRKKLIEAQEMSLSMADYGRLIKLVVPRLVSDLAKEHNFIAFVEHNELDNCSVLRIVTNEGYSYTPVSYPNTQSGLLDAMRVAELSDTILGVSV